MSALRGQLNQLRQIPPSVGLAIVLMVALVARLSLAFRAPLLVTGDSEGYLIPAFALAHGLELDLSLKRTPAYPAFVALSLLLQGDDLQSLALLQHLLGLVTVAATFWLGRSLGGVITGVSAGLITGISGTLLMAEHSLMTEALFLPALTLALACGVAATQRGSFRLSLCSGLLLGIAILIRPVALSLAPLLFIAPILQHGWQRRAVFAGALSMLAVGLVFGAWTLRPGRTDDAAVGGIGQTLIGRTARHDRGGFTYWDPARHGTEAPLRQQVRRILQEAVDRGSSGRAVHTRIRKETGLSSAEADALMRDLALGTIQDQMDYYIQGTVQRFVRLAQPITERFRDARNTNDVARQRWEDEPTRPLITQVNMTHDREAASAEWLTSFQPGRVGAALPTLAILGAIAAFLMKQRGAACLLAGSALTLLVISAALVGNVPRYRYPVDPIMIVLAISGITIFCRSVPRFLARASGARSGERHQPHPAKALQ
ncbi:MAG: glycosyltransferase family 39 protein [Chloroflexota bacterium]